MFNQKPILLSIIVPIYNAELYLKRCLESINKIKASDIEVLLIDDGSTDNSSVICKEYCKKDVRFYFFKKQNGGVSSTRNYRIKKARGRYIYFLDSDDYVESYKMSKIIELLKDEIEVLSFLYVRDEKVISHNNVETRVLDKEALLDSLKGETFANDFGYVWNKIYKKEIIQTKNVLFEEKVSEREDLLFNIDYFENVNKMIIYNDYVYHYIQYENSLSKRRVQKESVNNFIELLETKLEENYLKQSIIVNDVVMKLVADYIVKNIFDDWDRYKDIKQVFNEVLEYERYVCNANSRNRYLKILKICFKIKNIYPFYCYYRLSNVKKKIKTLKEQ
ncbi:glycosyltransferase family 2 protein [uncultured Eubacterium sp.]|jgi:glycosyltransferase, group 2 family|uniref:glycosyltransferase family 2 protein n=1 Tax=Eubacterium sp. TaxID=142586 RepID=UPI00260E9275|nr:glycosyltransferase family 2 protein [uncultured Eubacterium sp.]